MLPLLEREARASSRLYNKFPCARYSPRQSSGDISRCRGITRKHGESREQKRLVVRFIILGVTGSSGAIPAADKTGGHGLRGRAKTMIRHIPASWAAHSSPVNRVSRPLLASLSSNNASGRNNAVSDFGKARDAAAGSVPPFYQRNYFYAAPSPPQPLGPATPPSARLSPKATRNVSIFHIDRLLDLHPHPADPI